MTGPQVPAALLLAILPSTYKTIAAGKHADIATPRRMLAKIEKDSSVDKQVCLFFSTSLSFPRPLPPSSLLLVTTTLYGR